MGVILTNFHGNIVSFDYKKKISYKDQLQMEKLKL